MSFELHLSVETRHVLVGHSTLVIRKFKFLVSCQVSRNLNSPHGEEKMLPFLMPVSAESARSKKILHTLINLMHQHNLGLHRGHVWINIQTSQDEILWLML